VLLHRPSKVPLMHLLKLVGHRDNHASKYSYLVILERLCGYHRRRSCRVLSVLR
jgi:hypothetical protein